MPRAPANKCGESTAPSLPPPPPLLTTDFTDGEAALAFDNTLAAAEFFLDLFDLFELVVDSAGVAGGTGVCIESLHCCCKAAGSSPVTSSTEAGLT